MDNQLISTPFFCDKVKFLYHAENKDKFKVRVKVMLRLQIFLQKAD